MNQTFTTEDYFAGVVLEVATQGGSLPQRPAAARWARWPWLAVALTILLHAIFLLLAFWLGGVKDRPQAENPPHFISVRLNNWTTEEKVEKPEAVPAENTALPAGKAAGQNPASSLGGADNSKENTTSNSDRLVRGEARLLEPAAEVSATPSSAPATPAPKNAMTTNTQQSSQVEALDRPQYEKNPQLPYPQLAKRLGKEGIVGLEVFVSTAGRVEEIKVASSSGHEILDTTALAAVRSWRFVPGLRNGQPVDTWVRVPVRFALRE